MSEVATMLVVAVFILLAISAVCWLFNPGR